MQPLRAPADGANPSCRCDGTGAYVVSIPVADAVVSIERECPAHTRQWSPECQFLVFDAGCGRIGRIVAESRARPHGPVTRYWLNSIDGTEHWSSMRANIRYASAAVAEAQQ